MLPLTDEQRRQYEKQGYLVVEGVIPDETVLALRARIEELCADWEGEAARRVGASQESDSGNPTSQRNSSTVRKFSHLTAHEPLFRQFAIESPAADMAAGLVGTPLSLYADQALLKPPFHGSAKPPHQDNAYFRVEPADATVDNGCMHYLPGTHRLGLVDHNAIADTPHLVPAEANPERAIPAPVRAGGCIFHHSLILHMSPPNHTGRWRRAFVCHFARSDAAFTRRPADAPPLLQVRA